MHERHVDTHSGCLFLPRKAVRMDVWLSLILFTIWRLFRPIEIPCAAPGRRRGLYETSLYMSVRCGDSENYRWTTDASRLDNVILGCTIIDAVCTSVGKDPRPVPEIR